MAENETPDTAIDVEAAADVAQFDDAPEDDHEDSGLAAKFLKVAGLIVVGGVFALWAGPKVAPSLPSGMAPVAAWLAPGGAATNTEIEGLRQALADIPQGVSTADVEAMIATDLADLKAEFETQISMIGDQIAATDSADVESRLATLESKTEGMRAELSSLMSQLTSVSETGGAVSAETSAQILAYGAAMDGLKAEIAALAAQNGALSQKIDGVSVVASRQVAEAESKVSEVEVNAERARTDAAVENNLNAISIALSAGLPFGNALAELENAGVSDIPVALAGASGGVATMSELRASFPEAAHAAIRASIMAASGDGVFAAISAFTRAQVAGRSLTPQEGVGPDAVLSRAEAALKQDDLATALAEIDALPAAATSPESNGVMNDWIAKATIRQSAIDAYEALLAALKTE